MQLGTETTLTFPDARAQVDKENLLQKKIYAAVSHINHIGTSGERLLTEAMLVAAKEINPHDLELVEHYVEVFRIVQSLLLGEQVAPEHSLEPLTKKLLKKTIQLAIESETLMRLGAEEQPLVQSQQKTPRGRLLSYYTSHILRETIPADAQNTIEQAIEMVRVKLSPPIYDDTLELFSEDVLRIEQKILEAIDPDQIEDEEVPHLAGTRDFDNEQSYDLLHGVLLSLMSTPSFQGIVANIRPGRGVNNGLYRLNKLSDEVVKIIQQR